MSIYLDTRGNPTLQISICARCSRKFPVHELMDDGNYPGLKVCREDYDSIDRWRLPARETERVACDWVRPDLSLALTYSGSGAVPLWTNPIFGISQINATQPWQPNTQYNAGDSITPLNVDSDTTTLPQYQWLCLLGGTSGPVAPFWPPFVGVILGNYEALTSDAPSFLQLLSDLGLALYADGGGANADGTVTWLNIGIYLV